MGDERLAQLLCPPYDVIDDDERARLVAGDPDNAVRIVLPRAAEGVDRYDEAADILRGWLSGGLMAVDDEPALYVYEMTTPEAAVTRGLLGAVELRDYADAVILPHENTMAGPVADRLALMTVTDANLEPIYLVYDGGGEASSLVASVDGLSPLADTTTPDRIRHRLWAVTDPAIHRAVDVDLGTRRALIADGHHRYATYLELQRRRRLTDGAGPWDRGLTLLVDSSSYGPQVHAIHRMLRGLPVAEAIRLAATACSVSTEPDPGTALVHAEQTDGFAVVLTDGITTALVSEPAPGLLAGLRSELAAAAEPAALADLDVTVMHRMLVTQVWGLEDTEDSVGYAHSVDEAIALARAANGTAVLMRPTPIEAVTAVAAAGARMPRKSTLFTPKPASGLLIRRFADQRTAAG